MIDSGIIDEQTVYDMIDLCPNSKGIGFNNYKRLVRVLVDVKNYMFTIDNKRTKCINIL